MMLGGEIIRDLNETPSLRKVPMERILSDVTDDDGGPLIHHGDSEEEQRPSTRPAANSDVMAAERGARRCDRSAVCGRRGVRGPVPGRSREVPGGFAGAGTEVRAGTASREDPPD
ncbi:hypothetical protein SBA6_1200023 [Candidatus Sulfopaludibacter sp. SbA6]|nr:hypothetical protein SBA6_1200023 [Candidatus Sulfopaludibacter sp. SbA6]